MGKEEEPQDAGGSAKQPVESQVTLMAEGEEVVQRIRVDQLQSGRYQPRRTFDESGLKELASSIQEHGVMQPIVVRSLGVDRFEIVAGERRWRASQIAGHLLVPAIVRDIDDQQALALALIENMQREDLEPMEEAAALQRFRLEFNMRGSEIAKAVGKAPSEISKLLGLLSLPSCLQSLYGRGVTSPDVLNELARAYKDNPEYVESYVADKEQVTRIDARRLRSQASTNGGDAGKISPAKSSGSNEGVKNAISCSSCAKVMIVYQGIERQVDLSRKDSDKAYCWLVAKPASERVPVSGLTLITVG
ncbi:MAG: ParB/RepB/Spo0J family partition protein [Gammaproteobacteria bacterium]|nr:ParB/RepB/Spo0J family partition protein [Gammaproteobacteria bacterium]